MALLSRVYHLQARLFTQVGGEARVDVTESRASVRQELDLELPLVAVTHKPYRTHRQHCQTWQRLLASVTQCLSKRPDLTTFGGNVLRKITVNQITCMQTTHDSDARLLRQGNESFVPPSEQLTGGCVHSLLWCPGHGYWTGT